MKREPLLHDLPLYAFRSILQTPNRRLLPSVSKVVGIKVFLGERERERERESNLQVFSFKNFLDPSFSFIEIPSSSIKAMLEDYYVLSFFYLHWVLK